MKKSIIYAGVILAASFTLTNCTKEANAPETNLPEGIPFEIIASSSDTKTTVEGLSTKWAAGDAINVFHAKAGTTSYTSDNKFTIAAADLAAGRFTGSLSAALADGAYDWYAFYPYSQYIKSPANTSTGYSYIGSRSDKSQAQNGVDNMRHLSGDNYPLYGKSVSSVNASDAPAIRMKPAFSILKINVKNTSGASFAVSDIKFTAPEAIIGIFYIDFSGDEATYTAGSYVSNTASLSVSNADLAPEASASFYLAVKPFTANSDDKLKLSVNGYEKEITLSKTLAFTAGHIKTLGFDYDIVPPIAIGPDWNSVFGTSYNGSFSPKSGGLSLNGTVNGVTINVINGSSTNGYLKTGDFRAYSGYTIKLQAPSGKLITGINTTKGGKAFSAGITADSGNGSISDDSFTWSGKTATLTLAISGTVSFNTIFVTVDGTSEISKLPSPVITCSAQTSNSLTFTWNADSNASGYQVSLDGGNTYLETQADASYTWTGLDSEKSYTIYVKSIGDGVLFSDSDAASSEGTTNAASTGEEPVVKTYQHIFTEKPGTGNGITLSGVKWNITATNLNGYNSTNYAGVQFGTSKANGQITLTSPSVWSYTADGVTVTKIKEVRLWLNLGGTSVTPSVTIGGNAATSDGTKVTMNKSAGSDWTKATKVTFTPALGGDTGIIVIDVTSVKAGYICAIEIDAE